MRSRLQLLSVPLLALGLGAAACSSSSSPPAGTGESFPFVGLRSTAPVELQSGRDCDAVLGDLQAIGAQTFADGARGMTRAVGLDVAAEGMAAGDDGAADFDAAAPESASVAAAELGATGGGATGSTSDTNTQEAGIDEPDVVETDGEHVYLVDGQELLVLDGATADVVGRLTLATWGAQILLQGDRILAVDGGGYAVAGGPIAVDAVLEDEGFDADLVDPAPGGPVPTEPAPFPVGTVLQLIDVSDPTAPAIVETTEIEGFHVSTRVVDGDARVVVTSYPDPEPLRAGFDRIATSVEVDSFEDAVAAVEAVVAETTIDDWLPEYRTISAAATSIEGPIVACEDVFVPEVHAGAAETSILRVDFEDGFDPADTTTVVADAGVVYASAERLYLAASQHVPFEEQQRFDRDEFATAIHAFDLRGDGAAAHLGAGVVPGHALNQYSLSEYDGHLRIATTEGSPWDPGDPSESGVHVLRVDTGGLTTVGSVTGLGVTETIQSVRFMGPVGYVVTFRQTDPLYVIDLADPADPRAVGELKIPGFSSYLHPAGEGRLIGIGRDADLDGRDRGFLVSLFDVSDPTDPRQIQTYTEANAHSAAGWDPKAFLYWAPESSIAIPIERFGGGEVEPVPLPEPQPVEPQPQPGEAPPNEPRPDEVGDDPAVSSFAPERDFQVGVVVLEIDDDGITERGIVTWDGRWASRALVVQGTLWSIFDGGVARSDFDASSPTFHPFR